MNPYEMVLAIVTVVMIAMVFKSGMKFRADRHGPAEDPEARMLKEQVKALRERVQVLERIATDKESALEREIEQLRDR
jgi:plasmid stability protein